MCIIRLARFIASSSVGESSMDSVGFSLLAAQVAITLTSIFPDSGKGEGRNGPKIAFCRRASQPSSQTRRSSELRACRYWAVITRHKYKTLWLSLFFSQVQAVRWVTATSPGSRVRAGEQVLLFVKTIVDLTLYLCPPPSSVTNTTTTTTTILSPSTNHRHPAQPPPANHHPPHHRHRQH